jgi:hypothetical protein
MMVRSILHKLIRNTFIGATILGISSGVVNAAWEPTKPVEFVVPAGAGGGADQMARFLQGIIAKHKLSNQPLVVVFSMLKPAAATRIKSSSHYPIYSPRHSARVCLSTGKT